MSDRSYYRIEVYLNSSLTHVTFLVPSVEKSASFLSTKNFKCGEPEIFESEGSKEIYVGDYQEQSALLLLVQPEGPGPYQRAMDKRGPSLHHLGIDVLDMKAFLANADKLGWRLHPISNDKTSWFYLKGLPLLEVSHKKTLSTKPAKISEIQLEVPRSEILNLNALLDQKIFYAGDFSFILDNIRISFSNLL